jgi:hypothetical protein
MKVFTFSLSAVLALSLVSTASAWVVKVGPVQVAGRPAVVRTYPPVVLAPRPVVNVYAREAVQDRREFAREAIQDRREFTREAIQDRREFAREAIQDRQAAAVELMNSLHP